MIKSIKIFFDKPFSSKKRMVLTLTRKVINNTLPIMGKYSLKFKGNLTKLAEAWQKNLAKADGSPRNLQQSTLIKI